MIHSPLSSPSVDMTCMPPFLTLSRTLAARALVWRLLVRAAFVAQAQGMQAALLSIPRTLIANIISILAARRAVSGYAGHLLGRALQWDKTTHSHFPSLGPTTSNAP
jgi:adsorption protein B